MELRFKTLLENQKKTPKYFQNLLKFETKLIVSEDYDIEDNFIQEAIIFIEKNLQNSDFGINSLMKEFHMSQSSIYKKFKVLTGMSPTSFIRSVRLKHAARIILERESLNLSILAMDVGFNDYRYFKRSFIKHFGCLPSEYKYVVISSLYSRLLTRFKEEISPKQLDNSTRTMPPVNFIDKLVKI